MLLLCLSFLENWASRNTFHNLVWVYCSLGARQAFGMERGKREARFPLFLAFERLPSRLILLEKLSGSVLFLSLPAAWRIEYEKGRLYWLYSFTYYSWPHSWSGNSLIPHTVIQEDLLFHRSHDLLTDYSPLLCYHSIHLVKNWWSEIV